MLGPETASVLSCCSRRWPEHDEGTRSWWDQRHAQHAVDDSTVKSGLAQLQSLVQKQRLRSQRLQQ